jgi:hypothetical protein
VQLLFSAPWHAVPTYYTRYLLLPYLDGTDYRGGIRYTPFTLHSNQKYFNIDRGAEILISFQIGVRICESKQNIFGFQRIIMINQQIRSAGNRV